MTEFFIKTGDEITGPKTAEELKDDGGVAPHVLVRHGRRGGWTSLSDLLLTASDAVESLEGGLDPGEGLDARRHQRRLRGFAATALFLVVGTLWVVVDALSMRSYAAWASAIIVLSSALVATGGILSRRLWAWYLAILVSAALSARLLALSISSFGAGLAILLVLQLATTGFLIAWSPRGPALSWPPRLRRLLCLYSNDPSSELRKVYRVRIDGGPLTAFVGVVLFVVLSLGVVYSYHLLRFPDATPSITIVPRGGGWARLVSVSIYLAMVFLALSLGRRWSELSFEKMGSGASRSVGTGLVGFLFLSMSLLVGRWALRAIEVAEQRFASDVGLVDSKITLLLRDAICDVVQRGPSEGAFSLSYALWFYGITLLLGPVCEEVFFRGLVFASLRQRWPLWIAAVTSGLVFAVPHMFGATWGPATVLFLFEIAAGGIAAAYVYEMSGSLLSPIVLHISWNTLQEASSLGG